MTEAWRDIPGYEGLYWISSEGRIRSAPRQGTSGGIMRLRTGKRGYIIANLVKDCVQTTHEVHRIVAAVFIGPRPARMEVRHLNGDPADPRLANLAYGTRSENGLDKRNHGTDRNVNKTHCPNGHAYTPDNVRVIPSRPGARYCRSCEALRGKGPRTHPDFDQEWKI